MKNYAASVIAKLQIKSNIIFISESWKRFFKCSVLIKMWKNRHLWFHQYKRFGKKPGNNQLSNSLTLYVHVPSSSSFTSRNLPREIIRWVQRKFRQMGIKTSALFLIKNFLEDVFRSASIWAQPTQGKAMFVKDCCLKDCMVLGQRGKGASCNQPFNMLARPPEQCGPMAITHLSSNSLLCGVGAGVSL